MIHHLRGTSLALAENVFIGREREGTETTGRARECQLDLGLQFHSANRTIRRGGMAPWLLIIAINAPLDFCRFVPSNSRCFSCFRRRKRERLALRECRCSRAEPGSAKPSPL